MKPLASRPSRGEILTAGLSALGVFVAVAWPWVRDATTSIPDAGPAGDLANAADARLIIWILSWDVHALLTHPLRLFDANIAYPASGMLAGSEHLLGSTLLFAPVYLLTGNPVLATNIAAMATYVLAAFAMYVLLRTLGLPVVSGALGAVAFAIGPLRVPVDLHALQFPNYCLPVLLLAVHRAAVQGRAGFLALATLLTVFTSYYMAQMAAALLAVEIVAIATTAGLRRALHVAGVAALAFAGLAILSIPYLQYARASETMQHPLAGAVLPAGIALEVMGRLAPALLRRAFDPGDPELGMGWVVAGLAAVGLIKPVLRSRAPDGRYWCWIALVVVGSLLGSGCVAYLSLAIGLPQLQMIGRVHQRFFILAHVGVVGLAAEGAALVAALAARILPHGKTLRIVLGTALVVAVALPRALALARASRTPLPTGASVPSVYRWLATSADGPLLEVPGPTFQLPNVLLQTDTMYLSTFHWLPLINGHTGHWPWWFRTVAEEVSRLPDPDALQVVVDLTNVRWILVRRSRVPERALARWEALPSLIPGVRRWPQADPDLLLRVDVPPRRPWREGLARGRITPGTTVLGTPLRTLPESVARGRVIPIKVRTAAAAGSRVAVALAVDNTGGADWPALMPADYAGGSLVVVTATWVPADGGPAIPLEDIRLPLDVPAGGRASLRATLGVPDLPGRYTLRLALRQVGGARFVDSAPFGAPVAVRPSARAP